MAGCFGIMLLVTMYQMWFSSAPAMVVDRGSGQAGVG
jgi:hypothetical protein